ncbi:hypothetical protein HY251_22230 [bacterium]|nr:hypothetical protein [bacterium]
MAVATALACAIGGCRATGHAANSYFDFGGRTFTTNPVSIFPYCLGFGLFFIAGLPLDIFSAIATATFWSEGVGEEHQAAALAPSIFLGVSGGIILGAPFFPFGLPWWNPDADDEPTQAPKDGAREPGKITSDWKQADLETSVLPVFAKQAGVVVEYRAHPHRITLALSNVPWREALARVCDSAQTHLVRASSPGRLEMRNDYEDPGPLLKGFDPEKDDSPRAGGG